MANFEHDFNSTRQGSYPRLNTPHTSACSCLKMWQDLKWHIPGELLSSHRFQGVSQPAAFSFYTTVGVDLVWLQVFTSSKNMVNKLVLIHEL
ncbi:hypothetical protein XELAEV_18047302mg [Xenopus laevis]|uniref:Uncharacterized protein n=1 Tax=Xenopus laevis TaxID=8355 RepID=A0A974H1E9_XENLA|nr:hypothetical protein XELAEV_18047302mg [Xenopus laevis]